MYELVISYRDFDSDARFSKFSTDKEELVALREKIRRNKEFFYPGMDVKFIIRQIQ